MDASARIKGLNSPKIIEEIVQEAAARFVDDFARVEEAVIDSLANETEGGMELARTVWPRTVDEVRVLLT